MHNSHMPCNFKQDTGLYAQPALVQAVLLVSSATWRGRRHEILDSLPVSMQAYQKNAIACMTRTLSLRGTYL